MTEKKYFKHKHGDNPKIKELPEIYSNILDKNIENALTEVYDCYTGNMHRATITLSFAIIEYVVRNIIYEIKPDDKTRISKLTEMAVNQKIFTPEEYNFIKGMNQTRNLIIHDISKPVNNNDAKLMLMILIKILNKEKQIKILS